MRMSVRQMPLLWFVYPLNRSRVVTLMPLIAARTHFSSISSTFEKAALPEATYEPPYRSARPTQFGLSSHRRDVAHWHLQPTGFREPFTNICIVQQ